MRLRRFTATQVAEPARRVNYDAPFCTALKHSITEMLARN